MIKLTHQLSATSDKITRSGNILTFNGTDYDLSDLSSLPQKIEPEYDDNGNITKEGTNPETTPVCTDGTDISVFFNCDTNQFDDLSHGNLMRIHDLNNNGQLELNEFMGLVDFLALPEEETRKIRLERRKVFLDSGHTVKEWMDKGKA